MACWRQSDSGYVVRLSCGQILQVPFAHVLGQLSQRPTASWPSIAKWRAGAKCHEAGLVYCFKRGCCTACLKLSSVPCVWPFQAASACAGRQSDVLLQAEALVSLLCCIQSQLAHMLSAVHMESPMTAAAVKYPETTIPVLHHTPAEP